jgi:hypothetical protein
VTATLAELDTAAAAGEAVQCLVIDDGVRCEAVADFRVGTRCSVLLEPCTIPLHVCIGHVDRLASVLELWFACRLHEARLRVVDVRPVGV